MEEDNKIVKILGEHKKAVTYKLERERAISEEMNPTLMPDF